MFLAFCRDPITLQVYSLFNAVHTYVLKQQCSVRYQHQKVGMQFVSITIDMLQIPEKLLLHRILSSCAKRICVARCLKLSLLLLKQIFTRKLEEFLFRKLVEQIEMYFKYFQFSQTVLVLLDLIFCSICRILL